MPAAANHLLNLRWVQAFNERDWATEAACRTADYMAHMSGVPVPLDEAGWAAFMGAFLTAFPDARISIDSSVAEGDLVASRWSLVGTHRGDFQGIAPTGRQITMTGIDFSRVVEGKIAEHWAQFDLLGVLQQIGGPASPALSETACAPSVSGEGPENRLLPLDNRRQPQTPARSE